MFFKNVLHLMSVSIATAKKANQAHAAFPITTHELQLLLKCRIYVTNTFCINYKHCSCHHINSASFWYQKGRKRKMSSRM